MGFIDEKGGRLRVKKWGTAKRVIWRTPPPPVLPISDPFNGALKRSTQKANP